MPIQHIEPRRLYRQIADQLRALIDAGEYPRGTRLPPERDLALQLHVSRPSVREALIALELEGLVEVRMGSGIYVRAARPGAAARPATGEGPLETIRARTLIEAELAALAAERMTPAQVKGLRGTLAQMQRDAAAGRVPNAGDRAFHLRIAEAADNSVLLRLVSELFDERHSPLFQQLGSHFETPESWAAAAAEHRAVVDAIAAGSAARARAAMRRHLSNSHQRFTAGWPQALCPAPVPAPPPASSRRTPSAAAAPAAAVRKRRAVHAAAAAQGMPR